MPEEHLSNEFPNSRVFIEDRADRLDAPFLVVGMATKNYLEKAMRLVESCQKFQLPYIIYEVPTVHYSISPSGSDDLRFTKANFIKFVLERYSKNVLYLDVDVYFLQDPTLIRQIARSGYEFSIYNWLADEHTEAYRPLRKIENGFQLNIDVPNEYYIFSHSIDYVSKDQLICSGGVQYYKNAKRAKLFLKLWHQVIARFDRVADDECLNYTYNNYLSDESKPRSIWLDKSYLRYPFWIYVEPVINHPEWAYSGIGFRSIAEYSEDKMVYLNRCQKNKVDYIFPKDCVIDTKRKKILKLKEGKLIDFAEFNRPLWL